MMLESMYLGLSVVFPLVCYMCLGGLIRCKGWASENTFEDVNKIVFRVFMSSLLFYNSYTIDRNSIFGGNHIKLLLFSLFCLALTYYLSNRISRRMTSDHKRAAVIAQGMVRSNLALFGLPVSIAIYGEGKQGELALLMAIIVPIYNILAELALSQAEDTKPSMRKTLRKVLSNPLVVAALLGFSMSLLGIRLPDMVEDTVRRLGNVTTPLAFVVIGGSLALRNVHSDRRAIVSVSSLRLFVLPALILPLGYLLGLRSSALLTLLVVFASPIAVSSYTMAREKNIAPTLAGELVAATTFGSMFSIFVWITILGTLQVL